jgi:hypothetical protein
LEYSNCSSLYLFDSPRKFSDRMNYESDEELKYRAEGLQIHATFGSIAMVNIVDRVPEDVWKLIFSELPCVLAVPLVCKKWR